MWCVYNVCEIEMYLLGGHAVFYNIICQFSLMIKSYLALLRLFFLIISNCLYLIKIKGEGIVIQFLIFGKGDNY